MVVKKKPEEIVGSDLAEEPTVEAVEVEPEPFMVRVGELGKLIRKTAPDTLKFDSNVSNIDYDYVDTQQYKKFIGTCCDQIDGLLFTCDCESSRVNTQTDNKGILMLIVDVRMKFTIFDTHSDAYLEVTGCGLGISRGNNYALTIAQTNAIRNYITNNFLLPTSEREMDFNTVETEAKSKFMTDSQKAEVKERLLDKTKTASTLATVQYGKVLYKRLEATLAKDIPADFRDKLEKFKAAKFTEDGMPIASEEDSSLWIVKKTAAAAILTDVDEYE